jgi:exosortase/archaeosortase family protein
VNLSPGLLEPARAGIGRLRRPFVAHATARDATIAHGARTIAICLAAIVIAFHYSLTTLVRTLSLDTPLAYLGLVPLIALGLAAVRAKPLKSEPSIHDRQVDYIVGIPLLVVALAINVLLPVRYAAMFWVWRVDLVALPIFVAGVIALLLGVRTLWRLKLAIAFLILAWPLPYTALLMTQLDHFTNATISAVKLSLQVLPVAHPVAGLDGSLFIVEHGKGFQVSVATACSGVNGMVGYALVSAAFLALVKGPIVRKIAWLALGLVVIWLLNVIRILAIFAVGKEWGEKVAIEGLHPFLGLVTFCIGIVIMLCLLKPFKLAVPVRQVVDKDRESTLSEVQRAVPKTRFAAIIVLVFALLAGVANASLRTFDLVANVDGTPKLLSFLTHPPAPYGWNVHRIASYPWAKQFFGSDSTWVRYTYTWDRVTTAGLHTNSAITADVITTSDLSSFSTYGIEACYSFHGYRLDSVDRVNLGGTIANVVTYHNPSTRSDWTNVYWILPVKGPNGDTLYERVNLLLTDTSAVHLTSAKDQGSDSSTSLGIGLSNALDGGGGSRNSAKHSEAVRRFLVVFGGQVVRAQPKVPKPR